MKREELEKALARYREVFGATITDMLGKDTGMDTVRPWDVHNILVFGVEKYIELLQKITPDGTDLSGMDLSGLDMPDMYFGHSDTLAGAILISAVMTGTIFVRACLQGVDFSWANLYKSDFSHCNMEGACFENANLRGAIFRGCHMSGCKLTKDCGATFIDCTGLPWMEKGK